MSVDRTETLDSAAAAIEEASSVATTNDGSTIDDDNHAKTTKTRSFDSNYASQAINSSDDDTKDYRRTAILDINPLDEPKARSNRSPDEITPLRFSAALAHGRQRAKRHEALIGMEGDWGSRPQNSGTLGSLLNSPLATPSNTL